MGLHKGQTNNPNGRPQGAKSEKTKQWDALGDAIINRHAERFNKALDNLPDAEFINAYTKILSYFKPKLANTHIQAENDCEEKHREILKRFFAGIPNEKV
jgi:uncharacterized protein YbgA (DUF1722 family)